MMSPFWTIYILTFFLEFLTIGALIWQQPRSLRVAAGTNVTLTCNITAMTVQCNRVFWLLKQQTDGLSVYNNSGSEVISIAGDYEMTDKACLLQISRTTLADSGIFYCALNNIGMIDLGNGTTLIVSEPEIPENTIEIFVPGPQALNLSRLVSLLCLVTGMNPSQDSVHWEVEGKAVTPGHLELHVHGPIQAKDSLRTWLSVPGHLWAKGTAVTCVLKTMTGLHRMRTVKRMEESESFSYCTLFAVGCLCITTFIVIIFGMTIYGVMTLPSLGTSACKRTSSDHSESPYATIRHEGGLLKLCRRF